MCNCIEELEGKALKLFKEKNIILDDDIISVEFDNKTIALKGGELFLSQPITAQFYKRKASGERYSNKTVRTIAFSPKFCPFCGQKL